VIGRISKVRKRDGRLVDFDEHKIADAVYKAACAVGGGDRFLSEELAGVVTLFLEKQYAGTVPGIEEIQDMVEKVLIETGHARMAKAYILYRERRARAREQISVEAVPSEGPSVGNPTKGRIAAWAKGRIAEALVREADLDREVAVDVAARVEDKVLSSHVRRITTSAIRSLVEAELFLLGYGDRVGRQALVGLPRYDVDRLLRGSAKGGWRPSGPQDLKRTLADAVLAQYALSEVYSSEVVDAHLEARIHINDVGCPFEWVAAIATAPEADPDTWVDATAQLAGRLGGLVTRELTLVGLARHRSPNALGEARRLLTHSALSAIDPRGGRFRLALSVPAMAEDEDTAHWSEALVREHWARFRAGEVEGLPEMVLHVAASRVAGDDGRRALLPVLAAAAETGRVRVVLERDGPGAIVTPWFRVPLADVHGPAAFGVAGSVAIDASPLGDNTDELDRAIALALKALRQKRNFMAALQADPGGPLYRVAAGARPLVAGDGGADLVHLVGLGTSADPAGVGRLRSYACVRVAEEGRKMRLRALLSPERYGGAARRFAAARGTEPVADLETYRLPADARFPQAEALFDGQSETLELRFPREQAPAPEALHLTLCQLARDPRVGVVRLAPWPDRSVRASSGAPADL